MRKLFASELQRHMQENPNIVLLVGDLGYGLFDGIPHINCGAAEQAMLDIAVGLAQSGKIPFVYTITPFYYRAFETLRTYIAHEKPHVVMIGSGLGTDYAHDGYSHNAEDFPKFIKTLGIKAYYPLIEELPDVVDLAVWRDEPCFVGLRR